MLSEFPSVTTLCTLSPLPGAVQRRRGRGRGRVGSQLQEWGAWCPPATSWHTTDCSPFPWQLLQTSQTFPPRFRHAPTSHSRLCRLARPAAGPRSAGPAAGGAAAAPRRGRGAAAGGGGARAHGARRHRRAACSGGAAVGSGRGRVAAQLPGGSCPEGAAAAAGGALPLERAAEVRGIISGRAKCYWMRAWLVQPGQRAKLVRPCTPLSIARQVPPAFLPASAASVTSVDVTHRRQIAASGAAIHPPLLSVLPPDLQRPGA